MLNKIIKYYWAYRNKVTNKLFGVVRMKTRVKKKGDVLFSYFTEPFTVTPPEHFSNYHTMYWECYEISRLFAERGYDVDIINARDHRFIPRKNYAVCIDTEDDLERLMKYMPKTCKKIFHILISNWREYNQSEMNRLSALETRRGFKLSPKRSMRPSKSAELADYLEGFGNRNVFSTFKKYDKPIFWIPISAVVHYDFPENKDLNVARKNYLWMGGGGAVLKGLDITLEAFAKMPNFELHVCGPIHTDNDFVKAYEKELYGMPNIHVYGRLDVTGDKFKNIVNKCSAVVYPSGGDGTAGSIIQVMHAGLIPIISHETGVKEDSQYIPLENPTPESIMSTVRNFASLPPEKIKELSRKTWKYAREHYTREQFSKTYAEFIDTILMPDKLDVH